MTDGKTLKNIENFHILRTLLIQNKANDSYRTSKNSIENFCTEPEQIHH